MATTHLLVRLSLIWVLHFGRRVYESSCVHIYTKSVPTIDCVIEYIYYWGFACWISSDTTSCDRRLVVLGGVLWIVGEYINMKSHNILAKVRVDQPHKRSIPCGFLFDIISCPHYFGEMISWFGFFLCAGSTSSLVFWLLGCIILMMWARDRHTAYLRDFPEYSKLGRRIVLPFVY
jgi:very-long-chain enoyl-CoA reductase